MTVPNHQELLGLTTGIVASHVSNNAVAVSDLPQLIERVYASLAQIGAPTVPAATQEPAVPIRASVKPDYLVCLEDGKKLKMLRRYLGTQYNMTPDEYRAKWNLPDDYPMVAPNYAARRSELAKQIGLGGKRAASTEEAADAEMPKGRRKLGIAAPKD